MKSPLYNLNYAARIMPTGKLLTFANGAFQNPALIYKKLGKADLAAKDGNDYAQFRKFSSRRISSYSLYASDNQFPNKHQSNHNLISQC